MKIKKNDTVIVLTGRSKGKTGRVLFVDTEKGRVLVEGLQVVKKHQRPTQKNPKGGIITKEAPIHISNVALVVSGEKGPRPTRVGFKMSPGEGGKMSKVRIARATGEEI